MLEWVVSCLFADRLSRKGSAEALNTTGPLTTWTSLDYNNKTADFHNQLLNDAVPLSAPSAEPYITEEISITIQGLNY